MLKLISNGVQINTSLRRRSHLLYSTATSSLAQRTHFMVDYLVASLGFSREEAVAASTKVSRLKSPQYPDSVINFFKQVGLSRSQIKTIVSYYPSWLAISDINKTLAPKIRFFQDLGLSGSDLGSLLASNPSVITRGLDSHLKPAIECLRSIMGSDENVIKAIKRSSLLANCNAKKLHSNELMLRSYGLNQERLRKLVIYNPWHLFCQTEILEKKLRAVEEEMGIPRESLMFLHGIHVYSSISRDTMESKFRVFESYGWEESDIKTLVRNLPYALRLSEAKIRGGLDFFMKELCLKPDYLSRFPYLLNYSLENRVLPRWALWKALSEKKLISSKISFCSFLYTPEDRFLDKYVVPFKDQFPELFYWYVNKRLSSSSSSSVAK